MTREPQARLDDILEAITRARTADQRLALAQVHGDDDGVQIAFESILHNLFVIGEAVKGLPPELLEQAPEVPWNEIAAMRDVIGHHYHRIVPAIIHRSVEHDLGPLEESVRRLRSLM